MRLIRRFAGSAGLRAAAAGMLGLSVFLLASPALAEVASGGATGAVNPNRATPGSQVTFAISCASLSAKSATLFGTSLGLPQHIPMNKSAAQGDFAVTVTLPGNIRPGDYTPDMDCSDGSSAKATLTVTGTPMPAKGGAATGDGVTSTQTNSGLAVGGLALIGAGAVLGGFALRRRGTSRRS